MKRKYVVECTRTTMKPRFYDSFDEEQFNNLGVDYVNEDGESAVTIDGVEAGSEEEAVCIAVDRICDNALRRGFTSEQLEIKNSVYNGLSDVSVNVNRFYRDKIMEIYNDFTVTKIDHAESYSDWFKSGWITNEEIAIAVKEYNQANAGGDESPDYGFLMFGDQGVWTDTFHDPSRFSYSIYHNADILNIGEAVKARYGEVTEQTVKEYIATENWNDSFSTHPWWNQANSEDIDNLHQCVLTNPPHPISPDIQKYGDSEKLNRYNVTDCSNEWAYFLGEDDQSGEWDSWINGWVMAKNENDALRLAILTDLKEFVDDKYNYTRFGKICVKKDGYTMFNHVGKPFHECMFDVELDEDYCTTDNE